MAVLVVLASAAGRAQRLEGGGRARRVLDVPVRTVRRWIDWWETVFALGAFFTEAKGFFATPIEVGELPASLLARFGSAGAEALGKMLRFIAPVTTSSVRARMAMVA